MKLSLWSVAAGVTWSVIVFGALSYIVLARGAPCFDCGFQRGVPFILFRDGSFPLGSQIAWTGLLADLLVAFVSGVALAWIIRPAIRK